MKVLVPASNILVLVEFAAGTAELAGMKEKLLVPPAYA
jgi:hypothetical protein